jgi:hypothetical protein
MALAFATALLSCTVLAQAIPSQRLDTGTLNDLGTIKAHRVDEIVVGVTQAGLPSVTDVGAWSVLSPLIHNLSEQRTNAESLGRGL